MGQTAMAGAEKEAGRGTRERAKQMMKRKMSSRGDQLSDSSLALFRWEHRSGAKSGGDFGTGWLQGLL